MKLNIKFDNNVDFEELEKLGFKKGWRHFYGQMGYDDYEAYNLGNVYINIETREVSVLTYDGRDVDEKDLAILLRLAEYDYLYVQYPHITFDIFQREYLKRYKEKYGIEWIARDDPYDGGTLYGYVHKPCMTEHSFKGDGAVVIFDEIIEFYNITFENSPLKLDDIINSKGDKK